jgi:hypothetical protein
MSLCGQQTLVKLCYKYMADRVENNHECVCGASPFLHIHVYLCPTWLSRFALHVTLIFFRLKPFEFDCTWEQTASLS